MAEDPKFEKLVRQGIARDFKAIKKQPYNLNLGGGPIPTPALQAESWMQESGEPSKLARQLTRRSRRSALKGIVLDREMRVGKIALIENELQQFGRTVIKGLPVVAAGLDLAQRIRRKRQEKKAQ